MKSECFKFKRGWVVKTRVLEQVLARKTIAGLAVKRGIRSTKAGKRRPVLQRLGSRIQ